MSRSMFLFAVILLLTYCARADDDLHRMVVGERFLELVENRQITYRADGQVSGAWISPNGASLLCQFDADAEGDAPEPASRLVIMPRSGGRPVPLTTGLDVRGGQLPAEADELVPMMQDLGIETSLVWSPNSRLIALPAMHTTYKRSSDGQSLEQSSQQTCIAVMSASGNRQMVFSLSGLGELDSPLVWSTDSKKIACTLISSQEGEDGKGWLSYRLCVLDLASGSAQTVRTGKDPMVPVGWGSDGKAVSFAERRVKTQVWQFMEASLDGKSVRTVGEYADPNRTSPNGVYQLLNQDGTGIRIEDRSTRKQIAVVKSTDVLGLGWSPDSRMLMYYRLQTIEGENGTAYEPITTLWLVYVAGAKRNHMCIALDAELGYSNPIPTWSTDCSKLAYISRGRACVAELTWTELDADGKLEAGLPLTEEEEKDMIVRNASQLAKSILSYTADQNDRFPPAESFRKDIEPYLPSADAFLRPGTDQYIVQYFPQPPISQIESTSDTMLATLDAGYGWQVVLYVDGHVKVVQKQ